MNFRALLAAVLLLGACTKTASTAGTSTSAGPQVAAAPAQQPSTGAPVQLPEVLRLQRPKGGEWMGLYLQGKKAGWAFTDVTQGQWNGQPAIQAVSDVALSATIGGAKTERKVHEVRYYELKDAGRLLAVEIDKTGDGGEEHIRGVTKGDKLELTITHPGRAPEVKTMPASGETAEQADAPRLVLAHGQPIAGKAFDEDQLADKNTQTTLGAPGELASAGVTVKVRRVSQVDDKDKLPTTLSFDEQGRALEARFGEPPVMVGKAEPEQTAKQLEVVDLFALTRVVLDKAPGQQAFGDHPQLVLEVKGLPKDFQRTTSRQSYLPKADGLTQVTISGHPPKAQATLPEAASTPELKDALKSDRQVEADDPAIKSQAKAIVGEEKDAWTAAQKLSKWVNVTLQKAYGESSDRATDVLQRKVGDCTEHALLFTALARSVGLPARRVDGLVYMGTEGQPPALYWHEWAEVWIGKEWISIDPTFDEPVADATHLALGEEGRADSAALIGQLAITVAK